MKLRFNADDSNSKMLRQMQKEYNKRFAPARMSLSALANLAIKNGVHPTNQKLEIYPALKPKSIKIRVSLHKRLRSFAKSRGMFIDGVVDLAISSWLDSAEVKKP